MENAAKALLIAGEILIGIIILTIMVALFSRMGEISQSFNSRAEKKEKVMFNTEYSKYATGEDKSFLTPEEVITLINKVYSWNMSTEDTNEKIKLTVNDTEIIVNGNNITIEDKDDLIEFLKENKKYDVVYDKLDKIKNNTLSEEELKSFEDTKFTCQISYKEGRVNTIKIETVED